LDFEGKTGNVPEEVKTLLEAGEVLEGLDKGSDVVSKSAIGSVWDSLSEKLQEGVNGEDEDGPGQGATLDDARLNLVESSVGVASSVDAHVVFVQGSDVVKEALWETHGAAYNHDQLVRNAGEGGAEVEKDDRRELLDRLGTGNGSHAAGSPRGREPGGRGGGRDVEYPRSGVDVDDVVQTLSSANEPVLLGVGPVGDGVRHGEVDSGGYGLVVCVFKAEGSGVLSSSLHAAEGVVVSGTFGEEDSERVVAAGGGVPPSIIIRIAR
jgi:hypothetical protein